MMDVNDTGRYQLDRETNLALNDHRVRPHLEALALSQGHTMSALWRAIWELRATPYTTRRDVETEPIPTPPAAPSEALQGDGEAVACTLGVGCDEAGVCYAAAHGQPEMCGRPPASEALQGGGRRDVEMENIARMRADVPVMDAHDVGACILAASDPAAMARLLADLFEPPPVAQGDERERLTVEEAAAPFLRALDEQEQAAAWDLDDDGPAPPLSDHATLTGGPFGSRLTVRHARALRAALRSAPPIGEQDAQRVEDAAWFEEQAVTAERFAGGDFKEGR